MIRKGIGSPGRIYLLLVTVISLFLISCGPAVYYEEYQSIPHSEWDKDEECFFTFRIDDASRAYNVSIEIRNNNKYPYQNFWLFSRADFPDGTVLKDTLEVELADDFGKWKGEGISVFQTSLPYFYDYLFPDTGKYTISIRQGMRRDLLPGIQEIGLRVQQR